MYEANVAGIHIRKLAEYTLDKAKEDNEETFLTFNGICVRVKPSDNVEDIISDYCSKTEK